MPPKTKFVRDPDAPKDKLGFLQVFKLWFWTASVVALILVILSIFGYLLEKFPPKEQKAVSMIEMEKREADIQIPQKPDEKTKETDGKVRMGK